MRKSIVFSIVLSTLLLAGCNIHYIQSAEEFRQYFRDSKSKSVKIDSFVVRRDFNQVARTMKKMANKCLRGRVKTVASGYGSHQVLIDRFTPTVRISRNKAELHFQIAHESGVYSPGKVPKNGFYVLVADATRVGRNKTRIDMYLPPRSYKNVIKAIKGWTKGTNYGCPDLTKVHG